MSSYSELVSTILNETLACQDLENPESKDRLSGRYKPFGPYIPSGRDGSYPTTDAAMAALADLADRVRSNDASLKLAISRDRMRKLAAESFGESLNEIAQESDPRKRWLYLRERLLTKARSLGKSIMHYVPVWIFWDEGVEAFSIGPVRFVRRDEWLDVVADRRGQISSWIPGVRQLWAGKRLKGGSLRAGFSGVFRVFRSRSFSPKACAAGFRSTRQSSEPRHVQNGRRVAQMVHPNQWVACAEVEGFETEESRRRGLLAIRVALDSIRSTLVRDDRKHISTVADSTVPITVDRLSQISGEDLAAGWHFNRPGLGSAPGTAQAHIDEMRVVFEAAGECISAAVSTSATFRCRILADHWFNATHWFGRACLADVDFVAVVMLVVALDVLCGGLEEKGILELVARLTGVIYSASVLEDGTTLRQLVERTYKLRSEVAHGSILAVHKPLDVERAELESLAAIAMSHYAVELKHYADRGGTDDRDAFRNSLKAVVE